MYIDMLSCYFALCFSPLSLDIDVGAFSFSHIAALPPDVLTSPTPMILLATPGMLHGGLALKALKLWAGSPENLVLLPGYCVRGTVGAMLIDGAARFCLDVCSVKGKFIWDFM